MTNDEMHELLARIDERTKSIDKSLAEAKEVNGKRLDSHAHAIKKLEHHRAILHGAWIAISAYLGIHGVQK